jgi:hypothetical protein
LVTAVAFPQIEVQSLGAYDAYISIAVNNKWNVYSRFNHHQVTTFPYDEVANLDYLKDAFRVKLGLKWGVYDFAKEMYRLPVQYDSIKQVQADAPKAIPLFAAKKLGKWSLLDIMGNPASDLSFQAVDFMADKYLSVKIAGKYGIYDLQEFKMAYPAVYDMATIVVLTDNNTQRLILTRQFGKDRYVTDMNTGAVITQADVPEYSVPFKTASGYSVYTFTKYQNGKWKTSFDYPREYDAIAVNYPRYCLLRNGLLVCKKVGSSATDAEDGTYSVPMATREIALVDSLLVFKTADKKFGVSLPGKAILLADFDEARVTKEYNPSFFDEKKKELSYKIEFAKGALKSVVVVAENGFDNWNAARVHFKTLSTVLKTCPDCEGLGVTYRSEKVDGGSTLKETSVDKTTTSSESRWNTKTNSYDQVKVSRTTSEPRYSYEKNADRTIITGKETCYACKGTGKRYVMLDNVWVWKSNAYVLEKGE